MVTAMADLLTDPDRRAAMAAYNRTVVPDVGWETAARDAPSSSTPARQEQVRTPHPHHAESLPLPVGVDQ